MNDFVRGDQCRLRGQIVTIASVHVHVDGETKYLVEHPDKTFSKVRGSALMPIGAEIRPSRPDLQSVTSSLGGGGYFREPAKQRKVLK